ncbi:hypothetical protein LCGC14_1105960 [marine sediment metagenome]|uniref:Uncharacterized protein n=1 Tax=marine sediment metagenome TaxID=412755 RepID=A0A0F9QED2_9ZZZZ
MRERVTVLPDAGRAEMLRRAGYANDGKSKRRKRLSRFTGKHYAIWRAQQAREGNAQGTLT